MDDRDDELEESELIWENRTLQLMGFNTEEEQEADSTPLDSCITIDDKGVDAPEVIQLDDEDEPEADFAK
jgi:hypothetical protein